MASARQWFAMGNRTHPLTRQHLSPLELQVINSISLIGLKDAIEYFFTVNRLNLDVDDDTLFDE